MIEVFTIPFHCHESLALCESSASFMTRGA